MFLDISLDENLKMFDIRLAALGYRNCSEVIEFLVEAGQVTVASSVCVKETPEPW